MSVDLSKIKPGDEVIVRLTATQRPEGMARWIGIANDANVAAGQDFAVHGDAIVGHHPRDLEVGDQVKFHQGRGVVRAEWGPARLVERVPNGTFYAVLATDLVRVDD